VSTKKVQEEGNDAEFDGNVGVEVTIEGGRITSFRGNSSRKHGTRAFQANGNGR
jgi:hypothetical protein